jgi:membrane protease YdiL (CAAX protease family)
MPASPPLRDPTLRFRYVLGLTAAALLGHVMAAPLALALSPLPATASGLASRAAVQLVLALVFVLAGLAAGGKVGLAWPPLAGWDRRRRGWRHLYPAAARATAAGVAVGAVVFALTSLPDLPAGDPTLVLPPTWTIVLASIGAGLTEEVLFRFGVMSVAVWAAARLFARGRTRPRHVWIGNAAAALLFAGAHLPQARMLGVPLTPTVLALIISGNALAGAAFGWIFWRQGIIAAIVAHATTNLVHRILIPAVFLAG